MKPESDKRQVFSSSTEKAEGALIKGICLSEIGRTYPHQLADANMIPITPWIEKLWRKLLRDTLSKIREPLF